MANIVALNHPRLFAAVGMHSGPVFGAGHSQIGALGVMQHGGGLRADMAVREVLMRQPHFPGMPMILIQGEGDSVVRPINQTQLMRQSQALLSAARRVQGHKTQEALVKVYKHLGSYRAQSSFDTWLRDS